MNAFLLIIPLFLIRFGLLKMINKDALSRAALFAPLEGGEKVAYLFYQLSNAFIILYLVFLKIQTKPPLFFIALLIYILGISVLIISTVNFAKPEQSGINTNGIFKISRNPMYIGYFIYFSSCVLLTHSILLLISLLVFQISAHWIILSEERWCVNKFGTEYINYMNKVKRYI
ncbi:methyltransferase family protein [Lacrimispora sp.]|uniref:methyltransferase family protein n=1 Tax=Lacrimispora sp. TaxID=2719234 RepID=UPI00289D8A1F|nr:methyltransferase [Lacrimispora sp.]